ncbi:polysaccharide pyruvyl transferase family protein [Candidatus Saccharibacteria bacterium]|nr:polysaccharide pyruvyl transferase family protein [Candidatus Saccharibacteria bacterium]
MNLIRDIKHLLSNFYEMVFHRKKIEENDLSKTFVVMLAADYNNLGDVAITYAQKKFLESRFKDYKVIEIPLGDTCRVYFDLKKKITNSTIFTLIGGGNTGDKYELIERLRRFVVRRFKSNAIIGFPQTIDFSDSSSGKHSLAKSMNNYSRCKSLVISARETVSEKKYRQCFSNTVILVPDIVLSLSFLDNANRNGIMSLFRNDKEKSLNLGFEKKLSRYINDKYGVLDEGDTSLRDFKKEERYDQLFELLKKISSKKLVITDRLHGMIFCYITKTPCIVFSNSNHKIVQTYNDWLCDCNYIILEKKIDFKKVCSDVEKLISLSKRTRNSKRITKYHDDFKDIIANAIKEKIQDENAK